MTFDFWSLMTFLALGVTCLILTLINFRQAAALRAIRDVFESEYMLKIKDRRKAATENVDAGDANRWFSNQAGMQIDAIRQVLARPLVGIDLAAADGRRVIVSPQEPGELRRLARPVRLSRKLGKRVTPLLGRRPLRVRIFKRDLTNAGEWFDLEAEQIGKQMNIDWGAPARLWFYVVPQGT
jgi:hypothetical protein